MGDYFAVPPQDTPTMREEFLKKTEKISEFMGVLRAAKMKVYGMNWQKRSWDGIFQNLDRKFGIIEEILWGKIIKNRENPTDKELVYLYDGLVDLANYAIFAIWFMEETAADRIHGLKREIAEKAEVLISFGKEKADEEGRHNCSNCRGL